MLELFFNCVLDGLGIFGSSKRRELVSTAHSSGLSPGIEPNRPPLSAAQRTDGIVSWLETQQSCKTQALGTGGEGNEVITREGRIRYFCVEIPFAPHRVLVSRNDTSTQSRRYFDHRIRRFNTGNRKKTYWSYDAQLETQ